ncbi:MAG: DegV family protein [Chloroflexota bacterium]|nr:DegV family protein [Chloroflexota bacterium]
MAQVRVVTDSTAHIPEEKVERLGIRVLPHTIYWDDNPFRDGIDISREEFFHRLRAEEESLCIVPPSVADFRRVYAELAQETSSILSIHTSGRLSEACERASQAAQAFLGRCQIAVVDSLTSSLGLGILVTAAAEAGAAGKSLDEVVHLMRGMIPHVFGAFLTGDMEYLERGGYIDHTQSIVGSMLGVKPFLVIDEGEIIPLEKVTTREEIVDWLVEFAEEFSTIEQLGVAQSGAERGEEMESLLTELHSLFPGKEFPVFLYDPVLAYHIGPNSLGVIIYEGL